MFGSHLSIAGGLHNALIEARGLGMDCVQIFTKNQRQWHAPPLTDEQVNLWKQHQRKTQITHAVSHDSYLINLAARDGENREKSIALFRDELLRCESLGIPELVTHPGSHLGDGEDVGLARVAAALDQLHRELSGLKVVTCLEATAGQGNGLGAKFEHLRIIIDAVQQPDRLGVCLDTAHLLEAGYDLTSAAGCRAVLEQFDDVVGLDRVRVLHVNDSKTPRGSHVDRHEHIGHGHVSLDAFAVIVRHPGFKNIPKILETPKADAPDGRPWDAVNLELLRGLMKHNARSARPIGPKKQKKSPKSLTRPRTRSKMK